MNEHATQTVLTRGQLARQADVNFATVRYYERRGLLSPQARSAGGYHQYNPEAVRRVRFIKRAQELGFALKEVEDLLTLGERDCVSCDDVREQAEAKIAEMEEKIKDLQRMKAAVEQLVQECQQKGNATHCPILESLSEAASA